MTHRKKRLYVVGRGGLASEMMELVLPDLKSRNATRDLSFAGFLEIHIDSQAGSHNARCFKTLDVTEPGEHFAPDKGCVFLLAGGTKKTRRVFLDFLLDHFEPTIEHFPNFVSRTARIGRTVDMGIGNVVTWNCMFASRIEIGNFNNFNFNCVLSHDNRVGNRNIFSPTLNSMGEVWIGDDVFTGASVTIGPRLRVGNNTTIQAGITLLEDVPDNSLVRRKTPHIEILRKP
jgi:acetyltransferase-like isoleucine patch superfamily enzyme